jgi:hypothetical protein
MRSRLDLQADDDNRIWECVQELAEEALGLDAVEVRYTGHGYVVNASGELTHRFQEHFPRRGSPTRRAVNYEGVRAQVSANERVVLTA